jgi:hypothetical protein
MSAGADVEMAESPVHQEQDAVAAGSERAVLEDEENLAFVPRQSDKAKLLRHLKEDIYCIIRPSEHHGVGAFAFREIKKGVDPFETNGPPSNRTIDLTIEDVETLPPQVQVLVNRFFLKNKGSYAVPEAGLNILDISFYLNSSNSREKMGSRIDNMVPSLDPVGSSKCSNAPNIILGTERDARGWTKMLAARDIKPGEELLWSYTFTGRGTGCLDREGNASNPLPPEVAAAGKCRICMIELMKPVTEGDEVVVVDTKCNCSVNGTSWMHMQCAQTWYAKRIQLVFSQHKHPDDKAGKVYDRWLADTTATCEVCEHKVCGQFAREVMASVKYKAFKTLHGHIVEEQAISLTFQKIPETYTRSMTWRRNPGHSKSGVEQYVVRAQERVQRQFAGVRAREHVQPRTTADQEIAQGLSLLPTDCRGAGRSNLAGNPSSSAWDDRYKAGMYKNTKARFWVERSPGRKGQWVLGNVFEYVPAEKRNEGHCEDAECSCFIRKRGMYRYRLQGEKVDGYFSDYDDTVCPSGEKLPRHGPGLQHLSQRVKTGGGVGADKDKQLAEFLALTQALKDCVTDCESKGKRIRKLEQELRNVKQELENVLEQQLKDKEIALLKDKVRTLEKKDKTKRGSAVAGRSKTTGTPLVIIGGSDVPISTPDQDKGKAISHCEAFVRKETGEGTHGGEGTPVSAPSDAGSFDAGVHRVRGEMEPKTPGKRGSSHSPEAASKKPRPAVSTEATTGTWTEHVDKVNFDLV